MECSVHGVCTHTGYLAHGSSKGEARGRNRHKNNSKRGVRNMEEMKVVGNRERPKQSLVSAKDLTRDLFEGRASPYHRLD